MYLQFFVAITNSRGTEFEERLERLIGYFLLFRNTAIPLKLECAFICSM